MSENPIPITANEYAISSGHELASAAGFELLEAGGNAVDAGVAAGIALGVLHGDLVNFAGVAPIVLRMAETGEVKTIDGLGTWPRAASAAFFEDNFDGEIPEGILRTVVPAAPAAWLTVLRDFGTMSFADVSAAAIRYAREGFPVFPVLAQFIADNEASYRRYAENARVFLPDGAPPKAGDIFVQSDLARTIQFMADEERSRGGDRAEGLSAAYDAFYKGDIAKTICDYHKENGGFLALEDMAEYHVRYEAPLRAGFMDVNFYACGAWCQGVSFAQALAMLNGAGLDQLDLNSPDYIHRVTEVLKLVFADRERYVADPLFADVPIDGMLDPDYLRARLTLIDEDKACPEMPSPGDPWNGTPSLPDNMEHSTELRPGGDAHATKPRERVPTGGPASPDTSHVCVVDGQGNMFAATPSDTSADTEVIPGTGLCPSSRGSQSRGIRSHINAVAPGKRPRLTPNPALALKNGKPFLAFGTPGGDVQIQAMAQVAANLLCYGMNVQAAIEAPRFATYSFPSSFAPNDYHPGLLMLEERIDRETGDKLAHRGHTVEYWPELTWKAGGVCAIHVDQENGGELQAGADPRRAARAFGR
ncbi:MAG: gamma-glutamyltransferase family protein [Hyphomicrobiaceae bacterium]|nr:gamma-glutamyltransferase family protein [Hyphomicrobiaceae bacterium]